MDYMQEKGNEDPTKAIELLNTMSKRLKEAVCKDFFMRILN